MHQTNSETAPLFPPEYRPLHLAPVEASSDRGLIRVGKDNDGGYVISQRCVNQTRVLIGMGIRDDWSFEEDFASRNPAVEVVGVDGSISYERFVDRHFVPAVRTGLAFVRLQRSDAKGQFRAALKWMRKAQAFREFEKANPPVHPRLSFWTATAVFPSPGQPSGGHAYLHRRWTCSSRWHDSAIQGSAARVTEHRRGERAGGGISRLRSTVGSVSQSHGFAERAVRRRAYSWQQLRAVDT